MGETELLSVEGLTLAFGGVRALSDVTVSVGEGAITAIIGPNGAGKTSLLNVISGFYRPTAGSLTYDGQNLLALPGHARARLGIARTFQNIALFRGMTVLENIKLGAHAQLRTGLGGAALFLGRARREEAALTARIDRELIPFLDLAAFRDREILGLPYGVQKRVELARALVTTPRLLLLDEPLAGMNATEKREMTLHIRRVVTELKATVVLIDHDMESVMSLSDRLVVLNFGEVIAHGTPDEIRRNPQVIQAYLGAEAA